MVIELPGKVAMLCMNRQPLAGAAGVGLPAAAMLWLAFNRGPLAPMQMQIATVKEFELAPSVFGIGTAEARHAYAMEFASSFTSNFAY
ncbi:MAG TPA: hypothetical protein VLT92_06935 [Burkholderiales bacterium]|nr:hypothetical protein [Burkholderiales bacterium]